jgi:hypothetical protein
MASKAKPNETNWLERDGEETEVWYHAAGRYRQVNTHDHRAVPARTWTITVTDRDTGRTVTLFAAENHHGVVRDQAFAQIGAIADDRARKAVASWPIGRLPGASWAEGGIRRPGVALTA